MRFDYDLQTLVRSDGIVIQINQPNTVLVYPYLFQLIGSTPWTSVVDCASHWASITASHRCIKLGHADSRPMIQIQPSQSPPPNKNHETSNASIFFVEKSLIRRLE